MRGVLTNAQAQALSAYRRAVDRYHKTIGPPKAPDGNWEKTPGRPLVAENSSFAQLAALRFCEAEKALETCGSAAEAAVNIVVRNDVEPSPHYYAPLRVGASGLAAHYGIEESEKGRAVG
jgi:hypothetical protein